MKKIVKITIILLLTTNPYKSFSQTFGLQVGYNLSTMNIVTIETSIPYETQPLKAKVTNGFNIGVSGNFSILEKLTIETGLIFSSCGYNNMYKEPFGTGTLKVNERNSLYFMYIPLLANTNFSFSGVNIFGSFGPYVGMGLAGVVNTTVTFIDLTETDKTSIKWGSEPGIDNFRRLDYGLKVGTGIILNSFQIGLFYDLGLANLSPASNYGYLASNRVMGVSVKYMFGGNSHNVEEGEKKKPEKSIEAAKTVKTRKKQKELNATLEAERARTEKIRLDSIALIKAEEERIRIEKARADSIENARVNAARLEAERIRLEKLRTDSIAEAQKAVIYRVQFISNTTKKGSYELTIGGKKYKTWEYLYSGAYRQTVGELKSFKEAFEFQKAVRLAGYPQAFVVAFKNNIRVTDPDLFR